MFARISSIFFFLFFAFPLLAAATAFPRTENQGSCNTGTALCCNSAQSATTTSAGLLSSLLGVLLGPLTGLIGVTCSPISVLGLGANSCSAQPVCCTDNSFNGVVALGCSPLNLNV